MPSSWSTALLRSSLTSEPYRDIPFFKIFFYVADREFAEVKDACGKAGICFSPGKPFVEMFERSDTPACDNRYAGCVGNSRSDSDVKPFLCPIGFHAGEKDFTRSPLLCLSGPCDGIYPGWFAATVD